VSNKTGTFGCNGWCRPIVERTVVDGCAVSMSVHAHLQAFVHGAVPAHEHHCIHPLQLQACQDVRCVAWPLRDMQVVLQSGGVQRAPHTPLVLLLCAAGMRASA
jgi:hypothetical protein